MEGENEGNLEAQENDLTEVGADQLEEPDSGAIEIIEEIEKASHLARYKRQASTPYTDKT